MLRINSLNYEKKTVLIKTGYSFRIVDGCVHLYPYNETTVAICTAITGK